jgi:hypothetical protein
MENWRKRQTFSFTLSFFSSTCSSWEMWMQTKWISVSFHFFSNQIHLSSWSFCFALKYSKVDCWRDFSMLLNMYALRLWDCFIALCKYFIVPKKKERERMFKDDGGKFSTFCKVFSFVFFLYSCSFSHV